MAKTLCRVAGGGKPLKGNAEAGDVLAGKTFSNKQSNALTGTMPNNGTNKNAVSVGGGSGSLWAYMPYGYYDNYNNSGNAWIDITDDQAKTLANNAGVGYNSGYANGRNVKLSTQTYQAKTRGQFVSHSLSVPAGKHIIIGVITTSSNGGFSGSLSGASFTNLTSNTMRTYANQLYIYAGVVSLSSTTTITLNGTLNSDYDNNQNMNFAIIAIQIG